MSFNFSKQLNNLILMSESESLLEKLCEMIGPNPDDKICGYLWAYEDLVIDENWDLHFWLKRCSQLDKSIKETILFEYDIKLDQKIRKPLIHTHTHLEIAKEIHSALPITSQGQKSAFFLDRDGIINQDQAYVYKVKDVTFVTGIVEFIQFLQDQYDFVIVLTNQSGIGRGYYTEDDVHHIHQWMQEDLEKSEARIDEWYYCPYHPKGESEAYKRESYLRKPGSGMALKAAADHDLDLSRCAMVGDKDSDYLVDLQMKTFLIQGNYPLKSNHQKFKSLMDLQKFLKDCE